MFLLNFVMEQHDIVWLWFWNNIERHGTLLPPGVSPPSPWSPSPPSPVLRYTDPENPNPKIIPAPFPLLTR